MKPEREGGERGYHVGPEIAALHVSQFVRQYGMPLRFRPIVRGPRHQDRRPNDTARHRRVHIREAQRKPFRVEAERRSGVVQIGAPVAVVEYARPRGNAPNQPHAADLASDERERAGGPDDQRDSGPIGGASRNHPVGRGR